MQRSLFTKKHPRISDILLSDMHSAQPPLPEDDTVYVGLHFQPGLQHNKGRRESLRERRMSRLASIGGEQQNLLGLPFAGVETPSQRVAQLLGDDGSPVYPIFSELLELSIKNGILEWWECARWLKFEEDVEPGERWSKPYVATLSLHSVLELRNYIQRGVVLLDIDETTPDKIAGMVCSHFVQEGWLAEKHLNGLKKTICLQHRHLNEERRGKSISKNKTKSDPEAGKDDSDDDEDDAPDAENKPLKGNPKFRKKMPEDIEAANLLIGEYDHARHTMAAFIRLSSASHMGDMTEVNIPTRFIFLLIGSKNNNNLERFREIGRTMGTLLADEVFRDVAYRGRNREDLLAGIDEFLDAVIVLPPTEWDPEIKIEPPEKTSSQEQRKKQQKHVEAVDEMEEEDEFRKKNGLVRTGRLFGGLIDDVKRKAPYYVSDFKDGFSVQSVAAILFLYFATLSPIITFGGLLDMATGRNVAVIESLVAALISGVIYGFLSGQPLTILNTTGPVLVFETITYNFCQEYGLNFLEFRLWIGIWIGIITLVLVAFECSYLVCFITRFTEENFALLIAVVYIYQSIEKMILIAKEFPMKTHPELRDGDCWITGTPNVSALYALNESSLENSNLTSNFTSMITEKCYVPDIFLMSSIEFIGTFALIVMLKDFKLSSFFSFPVRQKISDFSVVIVIAGFAFTDYFLGLQTPKLYVPDSFTPTLPNRGWITMPFRYNAWWTILMAIVPAMLGTILIFMDQQITAVIINRKEHKLKKGPGYHLDLFVLAFLIIICSIIGVPWLVAGTVVSITHVNALRVESECAAPGEKPQFLGIRENRFTQIMIFILIGASVIIAPVLTKIPMPVLFGVFMYMGTSPLSQMQFFQRLLLVITPMKYQPNFSFLRHVRIWRVHMYTGIQLICMIALWVVKLTKPISIAFPFMLVVMVFVRFGLDWVFTQEELKHLDDILPIERNRRKRHDHLTTSPLLGGKSLGNHQDEGIDISKEIAQTGLWKQINTSSFKIHQPKIRPIPDSIEENETDEHTTDHPPTNGFAESPKL